MAYETLWSFETKNLRIDWGVSPDDDVDLSFDETGETAEKIASGEWRAFNSRVRVTHRQTGAVLGADYLGGSIYANPRDFRDHIGLRTRTSNCGSYFLDMVHSACREAREQLMALRDIPVRTAS